MSSKRALVGPEHSHHVGVELQGNRVQADHPAQQLGIRAVQKGFQRVELRPVQSLERRSCEPSDHQVAFPGAPPQAAEQDALAARVEASVHERYSHGAES